MTTDPADIGSTMKQLNNGTMTPRPVWIQRLLLGASVLTLILPTDLIPDFMPVVGWFDDLVAVGYLLSEFLKFIRDRRNSKSKL